MSWHYLDRDESTASPFGDWSSPRTSHPLHLPVLNYVEAAILASFVMIVVVFTCDPAREPQVLPAWSSPTPHPQGSFRTVEFSPDGRMLATGGDDGSLVLSDMGMGVDMELASEQLARVISLAFSHDGSTLAAGHGDSTVSLWDLASGKKRATLTGHSGLVKGVAFSPDDKIMASADASGSIRLWDIASGKTKANFRGHRDAVSAVAFAPDGFALASACGEGAVKVWDLERKVRREHPGQQPSAWDPTVMR